MQTARRQSRELALQVLFQLEFSQHIDFRESLEIFRKNFEAPAEVWSYADELLEGIITHREQIDSLMQSSTAHWSLKRMALVDRNLMRIAIFEICYLQGTTPPKVAINEALEIAKKYSSTDSAGFINGVLDQVLKTQKSAT